jgi:hypothetical protein
MYNMHKKYFGENDELLQLQSQTKEVELKYNQYKENGKVETNKKKRP